MVSTKALLGLALSLGPHLVAGQQQQVYGQCGGSGWNGPTSCISGSCCSPQNEWYSQCVPGSCDSSGGSGSTPAAAPGNASVADNSPGCGKAPITSGTKSVTVNGRTRQYIVRVPPTYNRSKAYRLIFAFHWVGGTMQDVSGGGSDRELWSYYGMQRVGGEQAILVAPQGQGNGWANSGGEDIAFVDAMVAQLQGQLCVDTRQLYALGFSYGGSMSYSIACSRAKVFRGVAVISGGQLSGCAGGGDPIAYMGIHGIGDGTLNIGAGRGLRDRFVNNNGCQKISPREPSPGSRVHVKTEYPGCRAGYPVTWIAFDGGHGPGPVDNGPDSGARSYVPGEIWGFFNKLV